MESRITVWREGSRDSEQPKFRFRSGFPGISETTIPFLDPWSENRMEADHLFQESYGQSSDYREQLALTPPPPTPIPSSIPFRYPMAQSSYPPQYPPLPEDSSFFPGQSYPPQNLYNYDPTEGFSGPPQFGRCLHCLPSYFSQPGFRCTAGLGGVGKPPGPPE